MPAQDGIINLSLDDLSVPQGSMTAAKEDVTANGSDGEISGELASDAPAAPKKKTPAKRKTPAKKAAAKKDDEPTTPQPAKKRGPKPKNAVKSEAVVNDEDESADAGADPASGEDMVVDTPTPAATSSKKRASKATDKDTADKTPTKKQKTKGEAATPKKAATPKTPGSRGKPSKFPESFEEFSALDKLLVSMKKQNKPMTEIEAAWTELNDGVAPGKDVLRKRFTKLAAVATEWKAGDAKKLTEYKHIVDKESWGRIADKFGPSEYTASAVQKKWDQMVKNKLVDAAGNYIGVDNETPAEAEDGDAEMKDDVDAEFEVDDEALMDTSAHEEAEAS